jgi:hypothetical protein
MPPRIEVDDFVIPCEAMAINAARTPVVGAEEAGWQFTRALLIFQREGFEESPTSHPCRLRKAGHLIFALLIR